MIPDQLRTLVAIVDAGSFDGAALELGVTPSAVSQRVKALEADVGQVVLHRTTPVRPTPTGEVLVRTGRAMSLLEADARAEIGLDDTGGGTLPVAVNADSLATWFGPVLVEAATWPDALRLVVDDQDHSLEVLRRGDVVGAVSAQQTPMPGCTALFLGSMRYRPVISPWLREQGDVDDVMDLGRVPSLRFNAKDDLQGAYLRRHGVEETRPARYVPESRAYVTAVVAGLGWGMLPEAQLEPHLTTGDVVLLSDDVCDVGLWWHRWRIDSPRLERLTQAVVRAARVLVGPNHRSGSS